MTQFAFSDAEMGMGRKRGTRRPRFPDRPSESCPGDAWLALAGEARSADAGARGGRPRDGQAEGRRPRACTWRGAGLPRPLRPRVRGLGLGPCDDVPLRRRGALRGPRRHDPARVSPPARALRGRKGHGLLGPRVRRGGRARRGSSPRGARRSARTTWSQRPPSRPPAASSSTSSTGSRTCSGCGRRATGGSPKCPTRPSPPSPQPVA